MVTEQISINGIYSKVDVMEKITHILLFSFLALLSGPAMSSVELEATRVVYNFDARESSFAIKNKSATDTYLVQSWIESKPDEKAPFTITPPLFRLGTNEEHSIRIIKTADNLPKDRESQFWLDIKPIPATDEQSTKDSFKLIVKSRLKLFYRPQHLEGNPEEAYKKVTFSVENKSLKVNNPTAYYITFYSLRIDGREITEAKMISPKSSVLFNLPAGKISGRNITWQAIADSGSPTEIAQKIL